ncbi:MAG: hypothetical protein MR556_03230 [Succinatimonas sp.]|nr:hypothetical protein [Succinatimonas sp.]
MDLKLLLIVATMSAVIGSCFGITVTAKHYRAEIINLQAEAIKTEQDALVKQLNIEHEWQARQEQADKEATDEINKIKDKYNAAMSKLHANSLHTDSGSANRTTLSTNSKTLNSVSACNCQCGDRDRTKLQRLYQRQLTIARDCDITAAHYNALIKLYESLE